MRKIVAKLIPLVLVVIIGLSLLIFYCCGLNRNNGLNIHEQNLAEVAKITGSAGCKSAFDKSKVTSWGVTKKGAEVVLEFDKPTTINALLMNEVGFL